MRPYLTREQRDYLRQAISDRRRELTGRAADGIMHGVEWSYVGGKCRCAVCTKAAGDARRARREAEQA